MESITFEITQFESRAGAGDHVDWLGIDEVRINCAVNLKNSLMEKLLKKILLFLSRFEVTLSKMLPSISLKFIF